MLNVLCDKEALNQVSGPAGIFVSFPGASWVPCFFLGGGAMAALFRQTIFYDINNIYMKSYENVHKFDSQRKS